MSSLTLLQEVPNAEGSESTAVHLPAQCPALVNIIQAGDEMRLDSVLVSLCPEAQPHVRNGGSKTQMLAQACTDDCMRLTCVVYAG